MLLPYMGDSFGGYIYPALSTFKYTWGTSGRGRDETHIMLSTWQDFNTVKFQNKDIFCGIAPTSGNRTRKAFEKQDTVYQLAVQYYDPTGKWVNLFTINPRTEAGNGRGISWVGYDTANNKYGYLVDITVNCASIKGKYKRLIFKSDTNLAYRTVEFGLYVSFT